MKRVLSFALTVLLLLAVTLAGGCKPGGGTESGGVSGGGDYGELPALDFGGKTSMQLFGTGALDEESAAWMKTNYGLDVEVITVPWEDATVRLATLVLSDSAPDAATYRSDQIDYPNYIVNNLVQPVGKYLDLNHPLFAPYAQYYEDTKWGEENYLLISGYGSSTTMFYNKKMFEDAGLETPWELYLKNEWDWNKMREYALELTEDSDNDGTPEIYGIAVNRPFPMLYSTGKALGEFNGKEKTFVNHVEDPDFARAMNFLSDMVRKDKVCPTVISGAMEMFGQEKIAMLFGEPFYTDPSIVQLAKEDKLGICPMARDPQVDKYYVRGQVGGIWIPDGAQNPNGAIAYYAMTIAKKNDQASWDKKYDKLRTESGFSEENIEQVKVNDDPEKIIPVPELAPWADPASWNMVGNASTWEVELAKGLPTVQALIDEIFTPLEVDLPTSPKKVDDFEGYGDDTSKPIAKWPASTGGSGDLHLTLDTAHSQGDGKYAAKITYDVSDAGWGGLEVGVNKTWEGNDALRFWIQGDGQEHTIAIQFTTQNGGQWRYDLQLTGTEGKVMEIPFSAFKVPEGGLEVEFDVTKVVKFFVSFSQDKDAPGDKTIYLDNIEVYKQ